MVQMVKYLPAMQQIGVQCLRWEGSPGEGNGYPLTQVFLPGKFHRHRSLATIGGVVKSRI